MVHNDLSLGLFSWPIFFHSDCKDLTSLNVDLFSCPSTNSRRDFIISFFLLIFAFISLGIFIVETTTTVESSVLDIFVFDFSSLESSTLGFNDFSNLAVGFYSLEY